MLMATVCCGLAVALANLADGFALIELEGAIALREAGLSSRCCCWRAFTKPRSSAVCRVPSDAGAAFRCTRCRCWLRLPCRRTLPVYLKLNTGMNRLGLNAGELHPAMQALQAARQVGPVSLMTHFADADCGQDGRGIQGQMRVLASCGVGWTCH